MMVGKKRIVLLLVAFMPVVINNGVFSQGIYTVLDKSGEQTLIWNWGHINLHLAGWKTDFVNSQRLYIMWL